MQHQPHLSTERASCYERWINQNIEMLQGPSREFWFYLWRSSENVSEFSFANQINKFVCGVQTLSKKHTQHFSWTISQSLWLFYTAIKTKQKNPNENSAIARFALSMHAELFSPRARLHGAIAYLESGKIFKLKNNKSSEELIFSGEQRKLISF